MTKTEILAIRRPEDLFPGDKDGAQSIYRKMSKFWHPDLKTGSADVFTHLTKLYREALDKINSGRWEGPAFVQLEGLNKEFFPFQARTTFAFPYGHAIVTDDALVYAFNEDQIEAFGQTLRRTAPGAFTYSSDRMKQECERYVPRIIRNAPLADGRFLLQLYKTADLIRLRDVVTHCGRLPPQHIAWVVSSLLNIACYLNYTSIVHHDISPDTYFISPVYHSGALLGGWWAAAGRGQTITSVPKRTYSVMPFSARRHKRASTLTDLELIRLTARECVQPPVPEPIKTWIDTPGTGDAVDQYKQWRHVLERTFGARRFVPLQIDANMVYTVKGQVV